MQRDYRHLKIKVHPSVSSYADIFMGEINIQFIRTVELWLLFTLSVRVTIRRSSQRSQIDFISFFLAVSVNYGNQEKPAPSLIILFNNPILALCISFLGMMVSSQTFIRQSSKWQNILALYHQSYSLSWFYSPCSQKDTPYPDCQITSHLCCYLL